MAVEIDGKVVHHEKPSKYSDLVLEHKLKAEKLKVLQKDVDELADILLAIDKSVEGRSVGNYGDYKPECNHIWGLSAEGEKKPWYKISFHVAVCTKCGFKPKIK